MSGSKAVYGPGDGPPDYCEINGMRNLREVIILKYGGGKKKRGPLEGGAPAPDTHLSDGAAGEQGQHHLPR